MTLPTLPDSLKNLIPGLEKATEINFLLLLTSFVLLADCAALYAHGMNLLHLSDVPDVLKPRLAVEAVILVIGFGVSVGVVMPFVLIFSNALVSKTVGRVWTDFVIWSDPEGRRYHPDSGNSVALYSLRKKAHDSKESYYLNLLKEADEEETERYLKIRQTAVYAFSTLVLSGVDLYAPLTRHGQGILAQIAEGLGQHGYGWLFCLGALLLILSFYPMFEDHHAFVHCPTLAHELREEDRKDNEEQERFRREMEARKPPPPPISDIGRRLSGRSWDRYDAG